ncbi:MAG: substrate-binding domain-containing protein [Zhaonellaceae bacterium]|jgi:tungstate transport system substrate-binding protein|nr:extracellular solute-binding protein [Clostridia bacterium]
MWKKAKLGAKLLVILCIVGLLFTGCGKTESDTPSNNDPVEQSELAGKKIVLATTTSTQDSGLLDVLVPAFEEETGIEVDVVAVGTGQAITLAKEGNADVLLVHARADEDKFVEEGYGSEAWDVMYNQFLIVGPAEDPAGVKDSASAVEGLQKIAETGAKFVSRGDDSGTHKKELKIWKEAGIDPSGQEWYLSAGQGMGDTLKMADELRAYALTDEATFLAMDLELEVVSKGDPSLLNPYGIIKVNSSKEQEAASAFINFIVGEEGQKIIGEFGKEKFGSPLFTPDAKKR